MLQYRKSLRGLFMKRTCCLLLVLLCIAFSVAAESVVRLEPGLYTVGEYLTTGHWCAQVTGITDFSVVWGNENGTQSVQLTGDCGVVSFEMHLMEGDTLEISGRSVQLVRYTGGESETTRYIGNKNSHVFHFENCDSVTRIKESNKVLFESRDAAAQSGYKPCDNCKP